MIVALRSSARAVRAENPSRSRLDGIHCWNPYWVTPTLSASSTIAAVSGNFGL